MRSSRQGVRVRWMAVLAALLALTGCRSPAGGPLTAPGPGTASASTPDAAARTAPPPALGVLVNASSPASNLHAGASCGATLISASLVLTAAHCVTGRTASSLHVAFDITDLCPPVPHIGERVAVEALWVHPDADDARSVDAAVLKLVRPARTTPLPPAQPASAPAPGAALRAFGWGRAEQTEPVPCAPRGVALSAAPSAACSDVATSAGRVFDHRHVCTLPATRSGPRDAQGLNTCIGDSGGPVVSAGTEPVLVGVISWGSGCGVRDAGINVSVAALHPWISAHALPSA